MDKQQKELDELASYVEQSYSRKFPSLSGLSERFKNHNSSEDDLKIVSQVLSQMKNAKTEHPLTQPFARLYKAISDIRSKIAHVTQKTDLGGISPIFPNEPINPLGQGPASFTTIPRNDQLDVKNYLKKTLIPMASEYTESPHEGANVIANLFAQLFPNNIMLVTSVFANLSANGRALPSPLHIIGHAFLLLYKQTPSFSQWVDKEQGRLLFLLENVRYTYADLTASEFLKTLENGYKNAKTPETKEKFVQVVSSHIALHFTSTPEKILPLPAEKLMKYMPYSPARLVHISQQLTQEISFTPFQKFIAGCIIKTALPHIESMDSSALSAFADLLQKLKRAHKHLSSVSNPPESPRRGKIAQSTTKNYGGSVISDIQFSDPVCPNAETEVPLIEEESFSDRENKARDKIGQLISEDPVILKDPDESEKKHCFVEEILKPALSKHGQSLNIDAKKGVSFVGKGGMSVVVKVFDTFLDKYICLRCDFFSISSDESAELTIRSYAIHAKLVHPNIVRTYSFDTLPLEVNVDEVSDPVSISLNFQRMEFLEGAVGLNKVIKGLYKLKTVPSPYAVRIFFYRLLLALSYCHGRGVIHRDIKPDNIMITPPENWNGRDINTLLQNGKIKLIDFGIAKDTSVESLDKTCPFTFTKNGSFIGTPYYASPEGSTDSKNTRNPKNDIWSLAITIYELLTARPGIHPMEMSCPGSFPSSVKNNPTQLLIRIGAMNHKDISAIEQDDQNLDKFKQQLSKLSGNSFFLAKSIVSLLTLMSKTDPRKRPTVDDLLYFFEHPSEESLKSIKSKALKPIRPEKFPPKKPKKRTFGDKMKKWFGWGG